MDAIGGGASVLAFVGLALQSAKTLHDFLSSIKDGPQDVQQAANGLRQFQSTLEQLSQCSAFCQPEGDAARDYVKTCRSDVQDFAGKLARLQFSDDEKRSGRYWKKIKIAFNEKGLARMSAVIEKHTMSLTLQLAALQRYSPPFPLREL